MAMGSGYLRTVADRERYPYRGMGVNNFEVTGIAMGNYELRVDVNQSIA